MPSSALGTRNSTRARGRPHDSRNCQRKNERLAIGRYLGITTLSFTAPATIADSDNGLAIFTVGANILIKGSDSNDRSFTVTASAAGSLTVSPSGGVVTESAGAAMTIHIL